MTIKSQGHEQCARLAAKWFKKTRFEEKTFWFNQVIDVVNFDISMSLSTGIIEVNQPTSDLEESPAEFDPSAISDQSSNTLIDTN